MLIDMYSSCQITAKTFCILCSLCADADVPGACFTTYAQPSGLQSGRYQQYLDSVMPTTAFLEEVELPMNQGRSPHRTIRLSPSQLVFEALEEELQENPKILETLSLPEDQLPDGVLTTHVYQNHPQQLKALDRGWRRPLPLAFYVDGVTFRQGASGRSDSCTGFWLGNLLTGSRFLVSVVRKSDECMCGCRGWCSFWPIMNFIRWQVLAMMEHQRPDVKWDGSDWQPEYVPENRSLSYNACLVYIKGDWSEHSKSLGLASWSQHHAPCAFCTVVRSELHTHAVELSSPEGCSWELRSHESYFEGCAMCETTVDLRNEDDRRELLKALGPLRRGKSFHGLGICSQSVTVNGTVLLHGDRLEPSEQLHDTHSVATASLPLHLVFWRARLGEHTRLPLDAMTHRCPVLDQRLHTSPSSSLAIDELHTLHLGQVQRVVSASLWRAVLLNPRQLRGSDKSIIDRGIGALWVDLQRFQALPTTITGCGPGDHLGALSIKMLGDRKGRSIQDSRLETSFGWGGIQKNP